MGGAPEEIWSATGELMRVVHQTRQERESRFGRSVNVNWFWRADPQVGEACGGDSAWCVKRLEKEIVEFANLNDVHGNHTHAWRWSKEREAWYNDFADETWVASCLHESHEILSRYLPSQPTSVRFGDRFMSPNSVKTLRALGYKYDLTPEPGQRPLLAALMEPHSTGMLPDYRSTPRHPYYASETNPTVRGGDTSMLMIPVTTLTGWRVSRKWPFVKHECIPLNLAFPPRHFRNVLKQALEVGIPVVAAALRSGDFAPRAFGSFVSDNLKTLFSEMPEDRPFVSVSNVSYHA